MRIVNVVKPLTISVKTFFIYLSHAFAFTSERFCLKNNIKKKKIMGTREENVLFWELTHRQKLMNP